MNKRIFNGILICMVITAVVAVFVSALDRQRILKEKVYRITFGINNMLLAQKDPADALSLLKRAKASFDAGNIEEGDGFLNSALKSVADYAPKTMPQHKAYAVPSYSANESFDDSYGKPEVVTIEGYDDHCMEPFITGDGTYLFYNNSNDEKVATHIHIAKRTGKLAFKHLGILSGTSSDKKDMAPTMDNNGNFYFTSTRTYDSDRKSLYVGKYAQEQVSDVRPVAGDIWPKLIGSIDMDCCISATGKTMVISSAVFDFGETAPRQSDLLIARLNNGRFSIDSASDTILKQINTPALEYAPALSKDELQLYFTRAGNLRVGKGSQGPKFKIMMATRNSTSDPFDEPKVIKSIEGFVEAPTITSDGSELYFHKEIGGKFRICRATRIRN